MSDEQARAAQLRDVRMAARNTLREVRWGLKSVLLNSIGGSPLMPRAGRIALLKAYGADVQATGLFGGWRLTGNTDKLHIGSGVFFNTGVYIESVADVWIGEDCALGMEVMILTSFHEIDADGRWQLEATPRPVVIGDRVWLGARAMVLPGVTIGEGCVIAAGAVVTKDCEPYGLYGGVPARRIRGLRDAVAEASS